MNNLANRLANRVQLTTDGLIAYEKAVEVAFGANVDFAMLNKNYGTNEEKGDMRNQYLGSEKLVITGNPNHKNISTSLVERQNLTMRTFMKRFVRKTCCFSKRLEYHRWMIALHFLHYNFVRIHRTLRITPAMAAGISKHLWSVEEIEALAN